MNPEKIFHLQCQTPRQPRKSLKKLDDGETQHHINTEVSRSAQNATSSEVPERVIGMFGRAVLMVLGGRIVLTPWMGTETGEVLRNIDIVTRQLSTAKWEEMK